jgi:hypothetical protein
MITALTVLVVCLLGGLGFGITGVYMLWGLGPAMILAGVVLLTVAAVIYRGMTADEKQ